MILNLFSKMARREIHGNVWGICIDFSATTEGSSITRLSKATDPYGLINYELINMPSIIMNFPIFGMKEYYFDNGVPKLVPGNSEKGYDISTDSTSTQNNVHNTARTNKLQTSDIFIYIPEFFYQVYDDPINNKRYYYIASESNNGLFLRHPGSDRYIGKYLMNVNKTTRSGVTTKYSIYNTNNYDPYSAAVSITNSITTCTNGNFRCLDIATYDAIILLRLIENNRFSLNSMSGPTIYTTGVTDNIPVAATSGNVAYYIQRTGYSNDNEHYKYNNIEDIFLPGFTLITGITEYNSKVYINLSNNNLIPSTDNISNYFTEIGSSSIMTNFSTGNRNIKKLKYFNNCKWLFYPDFDSQNSNCIKGVVNINSNDTESQIQPSIHLIGGPSSTTSIFSTSIRSYVGSSNIIFPRKIFIPNN